MGTTADIAIQQFYDEFIVAYQQNEKLAGTSLYIRGALGDSYKWPHIGTADMSARGGFNTPLAATPLSKTQQTTTNTERALRTVLGKDEKCLTNVDERNIWVQLHAGAVGRYKDSLKITALDAVTTNVIPVGTTNMSLEKVLEAKKMLMAANAPANAKTIFAIHADQWEALMKLPAFTSNDYFMKTLLNGNLDGFLGMKWVIFGDSTIGGLPKVGNNRDCFMWVDSALGCVNKYEVQSHVWYSDDHISFVADSIIEEGASVLDENGVVKIVCDETK
jgi:hypothetical protein